MEIEVNDLVRIISECKTKGKTGVVVYTHAEEYPRKCKHVLVHLEDDTMRKYDQNSVEKISEIENRGEIMEGLKHVAIVNLLEDYTRKDYGFALYETEFMELKVGDLVVINPKTPNARVLGVVKNIKSVEEYGKGVTAEVIGVVNMDGFKARKEEQKRQEQIQKERAAIEKELKTKLEKLRDMDFYERMAKEYSDKEPGLVELVEKLKQLTDA